MADFMMMECDFCGTKTRIHRGGKQRWTRAGVDGHVQEMLACGKAACTEQIGRWVTRKARKSNAPVTVVGEYNRPRSLMGRVLDHPLT